MKDKELKKILKKSPEHGFEILLDQYGTLIKVICSNLLFGLPKEDVEDGIGECFAEIWQSSSKIVSANNIKAYLIGITKNCAKEKLRKTRKHTAYISDFDEELEINVDMESEVAKKINEKIIQEVLSQMPKLEREIFIRRYYYCERVKSIAIELECSEKKIENILFRYKEKLKLKLTERGIII